MKFRLSSLLIMLIIFTMTMPLAAQEATLEATDNFPLTVTDGSGFEQTFDAPFERIVCLSSSCQDHLYVLGIEPLAISDYMIPVYELLHTVPPPDTVTSLKIDLSNFYPDLEQLFALKPDVVVGSLGLHDDLRSILADAGIPLLLSYPDSLEDAIHELQLIAAVTGHSSHVDVVITGMEDRLKAYSELSPNDKSLLLAFGSPGQQALYVETDMAQTCSTLIAYELAQCPATLPENAGQFASFGYAEFGIEAILNLDPDVIFFAGYDNQGVDDATVLMGVSENPLWPELSAVKNGQIYSVSSWTFGGQSGLTLLSRAIDQTMQLLYPDIVPEPLTDTQIQEILAEAE